MNDDGNSERFLQTIIKIIPVGCVSCFWCSSVGLQA